MATYTENYNLEKPAQSDLYNIDVFNENADKIDEALGDKAENQSLAPIESSATASRNYSVGQQFVYNGLLYEATSAIASGGTITPGSNCARTTVAEELSALNDSLTNVRSSLSGLILIKSYTASYSINAHATHALSASDYDMTQISGYTAIGYSAIIPANETQNISIHRIASPSISSGVLTLYNVSQNNYPSLSSTIYCVYVKDNFRINS